MLEYLFHIGNAAPDDYEYGKIWIKADAGIVMGWHGQWSLYTNGDIISPADPPTYPAGTLSIFIDSIEITAIDDICVYTDTFVIDNNISNRAQTLNFTMEDLAGTYKPVDGESVEVYYLETFGDLPEKIFSGRIKNIKQKSIAIGKFQYSYDISAVDNSIDFVKRRVNDVYENKTCREIIIEIINPLLPEITFDNTADGSLIEYIAFKNINIRECLQQLSDLVGYIWYVDVNKDLHFHSPDVATAPYEITDDISTGGHFNNLIITEDISQLKNKIVIQGGWYLSEVQSFEQIADGVQDTFLLPYEPYKPVTVYVDVGAGYVEKTLGIDNIDNTGYDFVVNFNEKIIKNLDFALLSSGDKIKISCKCKLRLLISEKDAASIAARKAIEGGTGIYEYVDKDENIETNERARQKAKALLLKYGNPKIEGSFATDQSGYEAGQLLTINSTTRDINTTVTIQRVTKKCEPDTGLLYNINFSSFNEDLIDFLLGLYTYQNKTDIRQDDIVEKIVPVDEETISIADIVSASYETPPYKWGLTVGLSGKWNRGTWG